MGRTSRNYIIVSLAIAGAALAGCNNGAGDTDGTDATPPAATTPASQDTPYGDTGAATVASADAGFYRQAMEGNLKEIAAGNLALERAVDQAVKDYAEMMVADHSAMNRQVAVAAGIADAAAPATDPSAVASLRDADGSEFDHAYMDMMVADHEKTIALFEDASVNVASEEARTLAAGALPKLREHLERARELQGPGT